MKTHIAVETVLAIATIAGVSLLASKSMATGTRVPADTNAAQLSQVLTQGPASDVSALTHSIRWDKLAVLPATPTF